MPKLRYLIEYAAARLVFTAFRALPLDVASAVGGFIGRSVGPFLSAHKVAQENLQRVFPAMNAEEKRVLLARMWDNLGRVAAEFPHLPSDTLHRRVKITGAEHFPQGEQHVIFFSGHIGNWELTYPTAHHHGVKTTLIYRQANNPLVDRMIANLRLSQSTAVVRKGARESFKIIRAIKKGHSLAMLVDQKMNEGIAVPFFGIDAMTAPAMAQLALRYNLPLIPARVVRTRGAHFKATIYPPLTYEKTDDTDKDVLVIMTQVNALLEYWIRETPEQWFWVHRRWPKLNINTAGD